MRRTSCRANAALAIIGTLAGGSLWAQDTAEDTQTEQVVEVEVVGFSTQTSSRDASLQFQFSDGRSTRIQLARGEVLIDGRRVGRYTTGGALERAFRALLAEGGQGSAAEMLVAAGTFDVAGLSGRDAEVWPAIAARLQNPTVAPSAIAAVQVAGQEAAAAAREAAQSLRDEIRQGLREGLREAVRERESTPVSVRLTNPVESVGSGLLGLLGVFGALLGIGFGATFLAGRQLDVVADTVRTSPVRSFFVGLFAQPLLIPAFGMIMAGLILTVVGIIVIPFAILGFLSVLLFALAGGYLAVARVAGERYAQREGKAIEPTALGTLRILAYGAGILLLVWMPAIALSWIPVASSILWAAAVVFSWAVMTTGFGAVILTRGGLKGTFGRRYAPAGELPEAEWEETEESMSTGEWLKQGR